MTANELRIGNWVLGSFHDGKTPMQIFRIDGNDDCTDIEPIALTPEILEKAGFTKVDDGILTTYSYGTNPLTSDWIIQLKWLKGYPKPFYQNGYFKVVHLHQLQNLYFALTGTELEINLETVK